MCSISSGGLQFPVISLVQILGWVDLGVEITVLFTPPCGEMNL